MSTKEFIRKWGGYPPTSWVEEPGDCIVIEDFIVVPLDDKFVAVKAASGVWEVLRKEDFIEGIAESDDDESDDEAEE